MINKTKRITAFILSLIILCCHFAISPLAQEPAGTQMLSSQAFYALDAMELLGQEFLTAQAGQKVTRAQFAGNIAKVAGLTNIDADMSKNPFIDVNLQTRYANEIYTMYTMGYINGTGPDTFEPNGDITYAQALKIAVDILGYREYTLAKYGAFPTGYIMVAERLELTENMGSFSENEPLTAEAAVQLLYNAGITSVMEPSAFSNGSQVAYNSGSKILLSQGNSIYYGEGVMYSNGIVSLIEGVDESNVIIGENKYQFIGDDFADLLGCDVGYFYKQKNGKDILLWAFATQYNDIISLKSSDLMTDDPAYSITNIVYDEGTKKRNIKIEKYAEIVYNNSLSTGAINPKSGFVRFIDNNNDKVYDVVVIEEFANMYAETISLNGDFVANRYGNPIFLDEYDTVSIMRGGVPITPDELDARCVISYIENADKSRIWMWVNSDIFTDTLNSVSDEYTYTFDNGEYELAESYKNLIDGKIYPVEKPQLGSKYKIYLDREGKIAEMELVNESELQYALLIDIKPDNTGIGSSDRADLKLLLQNGDTVTVKTAKKLTLNEQTGKKGTDVLNLASVVSGGEVTQQVVKISFDVNGDIKEFKTAAECTSDYGYDESEFTVDYSAINVGIGNGTEFVYTVNGLYTLSRKTICFTRSVDTHGDEIYAVVKNNEVAGGGYGALYDCNEALIPAAAFFKTTKINTAPDDAMFVVDNVIRALDENGEPTKQISGFRSGSYVTVKAVSEDAVPADLRRGDVCRYALFDGMISYMEVVCRLSQKPDPFITGMNTTWCGIFGQLYALGSNSIVTLNPDGNSITMTTLNGRSLARVVVYDAKTNTLSMGSQSDLLLVTPDSSGNLPDVGREACVFVFRRYTYYRDSVVAYY